jgi:hypothetical protein
MFLSCTVAQLVNAIVDLEVLAPQRDVLYVLI